MIASARRWTVHVCLLVNLWTQFTGIVQTTNKDDQTVHLQPSVSLHTNAEESVRTIHMICPTGTRWIVPETIDSSARISIKPYEARGSILTFHLPANNIETRWTYRGLYECCPMRSDVPVPLIWIRRSKQPMCCPCCPWYEQHQCLSDGMLSLELGRNSSTAEGNNPCLSTFLFTGTVNTQAIRLHIVPEEPMLLPCPAPFHTPNVHEAHFPLSIQHRFFLHSAVEMPWFPFPNNNHGIDHTYDPRYGLCLHRAQFPRTTLQLACHYQSTGQVRLVQTVWPPSSPTIPPEVQLRFVNSSAVENPPMWHSLRSPTTSRGTDVITVYRARAGDTVRVQCIGSYSQLRIVKQPPPRLCFSWNWSKKNEMSVSDDHHVNAYNNTTTNNEKWQLNACPSIQTTTKAPWAVYGTDEIELPPIHHPITVGCQIRTPTRVAPAVAAHIRIVPVRSKTNRLLWSIAAHNQQSMRILLTNRTPEQEQNNHTTVLFTNNLSDNTTSFMVYLSIHFWAEHETSGWPTCTFNQTLSTGSIRPIMRAHDTWQCDVRWRQPNEATNVSIWIRYANLSQSILIYNTPALNGTGPKLRGLHGNVRHIMQLSCVRTKQEQALVHLFNANQIPNPVSFSYIWDIELRDGPQGLTHAFNLSQHHPTLVLQPLHEENSTLAWSYHVDSNQLVAEFPHTGQPIPVRGPRVICARCRSVYMEQLMWYGSVECHPLTEWPLIDSTAQNTSAPQPSTFMLILRQKEMPTQTVPDRIKGISTFYTLESVPYELECIVSGGLPLNETRNLSPQLWPSIHGWNVSTGTHTLVAQQSWRLSPYSRTTHIKLNPIQRIQPECRYANHSIKVIVQPVHPTGPIITDAQAVDVRTTGDPSGSPINWYCRAEGFPLPNIYWELRLHDADQHNTSEWIMLHACPASYQPNSLSDTQVCNFTTWSSELSQAEQVRCRATSHQTTVIKSLFLSELRLFASPSSILAKATHNVTRNAWGLTEARWMISLCSLILLVFATLIIISLCVYRRTRKKIEESGLHPIANALYTKPSQSVYYRRQDEADISICCKLGIESDAVRELVYLLGSVEQLFRWHIPKDCVEVTGLHLGLGHYGRVIKGWYTEPQVAPHSPVRVPVAIKTASEELSSSQCLRNEIQILPGLSEGANIARMLGLIVGTRRDLSDTYLVLEYCEHRSLAEFVRKHASQLTGTDNRAQKTSIHSCDSGVYSMNGTDLGTDPTIPKEAVSVDFTNAPHSCMTESNPSYRLTYQTLYELAWGIANGVDFLARSGIIHRDLATRNVLVDACHTPRICDFGLAVRIVRTDSETIRDESYRITSFQKQLPFRILPLEALREQTFYLASDVWELGLLFWQLFHLESKKPFVHVRSAEDLVLQLQIHFRNCTNTTAQAPPALVRPRLVDDELWYMMCRAWQADPKRRPTAQEFSTLLSIILDGMRSEKRTSGTEPVHESAHELNYITCVDLNSTDVGTDKTLQELREPEPLV